MKAYYVRLVAIIVCIFVLSGVLQSSFAAGISNSEDVPKICKKTEYFGFLGFLVLFAIYADIRRLKNKVEDALRPLKGRSVEGIVGIIYMERDSDESLPTLSELKRYSAAQVLGVTFALTFVFSIVLYALHYVFLGFPVWGIANLFILTPLIFCCAHDRFLKHGKFLFLHPNKNPSQNIVAYLFLCVGLSILCTSYIVAMKCDHLWQDEAVKYALINGVAAICISLGGLAIYNLKDIR